MRAGIEEGAEMPGRLGDRVRTRNADAIESKRARFARERGFQVGSGQFCVGVQKSRST
jgi:hypothetical protein